ncbi:MAG: hypothetical protein QM662_04390 [Gordonia sp. (in: high G+C Gram-positive bacteria)]
MMSDRKTLPNLLIGTNDASWGDERERAVLLEGYTYVYLLTVMPVWLVGAIAAWFIPTWVTITLWLVLVIPSAEWQRFCRARHVDANTLVYARSSPARLITSVVFTGTCSMSMALAVVVRWSGAIDTTGSSTIWGGIVGGIVGGTVTFAIAKIRARRADARAAAEE